MSTFTLAISCLTTSTLLIHGPNIPGSYAVLLFTALDLDSITSHIHNWVLFLLSLHPFFLSGVISPWSPVAYWVSTDLRSSSFYILSFCLFILFMGFSRQEYWSGLPFPAPVDHILSGIILAAFKTLKVFCRRKICLTVYLQRAKLRSLKPNTKGLFWYNRRNIFVTILVVRQFGFGIEPLHDELCEVQLSNSEIR